MHHKFLQSLFVAVRTGFVLYSEKTLQTAKILYASEMTCKRWRTETKKAQRKKPLTLSLQCSQWNKPCCRCMVTETARLAFLHTVL